MSFGALARKHRPDLFGDVEPDAIDTYMVDALSPNSPKRTRVLGTLRAQFPGLQDMDDDALAGHVLSAATPRAAAPRRAAPPVPLEPTAPAPAGTKNPEEYRALQEQVQAQGAGQATQRAGTSIGRLHKASGALQATGGASPAEQERIASIPERVPTMASVPHHPQTAIDVPTRFPTLRYFSPDPSDPSAESLVGLRDKLRAQAVADGTDPKRFKILSPTLGALQGAPFLAEQSAQGPAREITTVEAFAGVDPNEIENSALSYRILGEGSQLLHSGVDTAARQFYNPWEAEGNRWGLQLPTTPIPRAAQPGEYLGAVGRNVGETVPSVGKAAAQGQAWTEGALQRMRRAVAGQVEGLSAGEPQGGQMGVSAWQGERRAPLDTPAAADQAVREQEDFQEYLRDMPPDTQREVSREALGSIGEAGGRAVGALLPTEGTLVPLRTLAKVPGVSHAIQAARAGKRAVVGAAMETPGLGAVGETIAYQPSAGALRAEARAGEEMSPRVSAETAAAVMRNEIPAQIAEMRLRRQGEMDAVWQKHGIAGDEEKRRLEELVQGAWNDPAAREALAAAHPAARDVFAVLQRYHHLPFEEVRKAGIFATPEKPGTPFSPAPGAKRVVDQHAAQTGKAVEDILDDAVEVRQASQPLHDQVRILEEVIGKAGRAVQAQEKAVVAAQGDLARVQQNVAVGHVANPAATAAYQRKLGQATDKLRSVKEAAAALGAERDAARKTIADVDAYASASRAELAAARLGYDPFHVLRTQNPLEAAKVLEAKSAREAEAELREAWKARRLKREDITDAPGMEGLADVPPHHISPWVNRPLHTTGDVEGIANLGARVQRERGASLRTVGDMLDRVANSTTSEGVDVALGHALTAVGADKKAAAKFLAPQLALHAQADPTRFFSPNDYNRLLAEARAAGHTKATPLSVGRGALGQKKPADLLEREAVERYLQDQGLTEIRIADREAVGLRKLDKGNVTHLPAGMEQLDHWFVPRQYARALQQAATIAERSGSGAHRCARELNSVMGLRQFKALITLANFGFYRRNEQAAIIRAIGDEGVATFTDRALMRTVETVSKATKPGTRVVIGGKVHDAYALRQEAQRLMTPDAGVIGSQMREAESLAGATWASGAANLARRAAGEGTYAQKLAEKVERVAVGWEKRVRDPAVRAQIRAGMAVGKAGENMMWRGLNPDMRLEDGLKLALWIRKRQRGMNSAVAAREANELLIDYGAKSPLGRFVEDSGLIPFWRYYTAMGSGALTIAAKNPEAYRRIYQVMRAVEGVDQAEGGGAFDPRLKSGLAAMTMAPMIDIGGRLSEVRQEHFGAEAGNLLASLAHSASPYAPSLAPYAGERGVLQFLGPAYTGLGDIATSRSPATGRPEMGLPPESLLKGGLLAAAGRGELGPGVAGPAGRLGVHYSQQAGLLGSPVGAALRGVAGLGPPASSHTDEDQAGYLLRTLLRQALGPGVKRRSSPHAVAHQADAISRWLSPPPAKVVEKQHAGGKLMWPHDLQERP